MKKPPQIIFDCDENSLDYQAIKPYFQSLIQQTVGEAAVGLSFEEMLDSYVVSSLWI